MYNRCGDENDSTVDFCPKTRDETRRKNKNTWSYNQQTFSFHILETRKTFTRIFINSFIYIYRKITRVTLI